MQTADYCFHHANENVTTIVPLYSNPKNNSPQSVRSLYFTPPQLETWKRSIILEYWAISLLAWDHVLHWVKWRKILVRANKICQWSKLRVWGVERVAESGDMPLMPPFHDTRFWYHALMSSCWQQYRALLISCFYNIIWENTFKTRFLASNKNFLAGLFADTIGSK